MDTFGPQRTEPYTRVVGEWAQSYHLQKGSRIRCLSTVEAKNWNMTVP